MTDPVTVSTEAPGEVRDGLRALALRCWQRATDEAGADLTPQAGTAWQCLAQTIEAAARDAEKCLTVAAW